MKIAFDLCRIGNPGIGRYMKCLVEAILQQEADNEYLLLMPLPRIGTRFWVLLGESCRTDRRHISISVPWFAR